MRGKEKRKFVVIIWKEGENREERREIRAVFAPWQAVYSSKLYLVFLVPATLLCLFLAPRACVWQTLSVPFRSSPPANQSSNLPPQLPQQTNQSYFTVWQSFILQFGRVKITNHTFTQDVEKLINQSNHLLSQSLCRFAPVLRDSGVVKK